MLNKLPGDHTMSRQTGFHKVFDAILAIVITEMVFSALISVTSQAISLGFGIATATGIVFGFYPAHRASRLNPIKPDHEYRVPAQVPLAGGLCCIWQFRFQRRNQRLLLRKGRRNHFTAKEHVCH
jgi:hypothetical protein